MQIKNKNFVSGQMTRRDVFYAFGEIPETLIIDGYLRRYYQYYKPTEKLLEQFIPIEIEIIDVQRLNGYNLFYIKNIQEIFGCDRITAKIILEKHFYKTNFGYWKRSNKLDELLAEGEVMLQLKEDKK